MKAHTNNPKLKPPPRHLFSCGFFRHCTQTIPSPTTPHSPPPPLSTPQPQTQSLPSTLTLQAQTSVQLVKAQAQDSSSSTTTNSSPSTSNSFTQWRFPTPISPQHSFQPQPTPPVTLPQTSTSSSTRTNLNMHELEHLFHVTMQQLMNNSPSNTSSLSALHSLESSLVPNPQPNHPICPPDLIRGILKTLNNPQAAKSATKVLLALCLAEQNRRVAVTVGAVGAVMEAVAEMERATAERALAVLELMCTVKEGAEELRSHALAVPMMVEMMGRLEGFRGKEYAISVLAVVYCDGREGSERRVGSAPLEEVARAVTLAMKGECSVRGRRKGALLLKVLNQPLDE